LMRSASDTDEPPYFCTTRPMSCESSGPGRVPARGRTARRVLPRAGTRRLRAPSRPRCEGVHPSSRGHCVLALDDGTTHGIPATGPVADSARELAPFVDAVLAATGASQVDVVGHSQGGMSAGPPAPSSPPGTTRS
jgi:pimeloyl-ACP methyl ester carboxylesterase